MKVKGHSSSAERRAMYKLRVCMRTLVRNLLIAASLNGAVIVTSLT